MKLLRAYIKTLLAEGRYESETTQISRDVVNWVKDALSKELPQGEVSKYNRDYPFHNLGIKMFDVPPTVKGQLNRLTATIKVDPDLGGMKDTFEVAGKAGTSSRGTQDLQVQIYLRKDFTLQDMNSFIADLKQTIIHELEHLGQSQEVLDTALPEDGHSYDWNKLSGIRNYYSSQAELEAYAKGAFKKAKVKNVTFPEAIDETLNSMMESFISRYNKHVEAGVEDRLDYNEQDLRDYFQKELRDEILDIARKKYPKAHGLNESNVLAMGMCFPFAAKKAEEWFDDHFTKGGPGRAPKRHPDLNNMDKFKVVHGKVTDKWKNPPKPIVHAWVEMGDLVFDDQTKHTKPDGVPKDVYYDLYQPEVTEEYTAEEAVNNCIMKGEGPWNKDLQDIMSQRDAWMNELRGYIRELLKEDPMGFVHDLAASDKFGDQFFGGRVNKEAAREIKRAFNDNADHQFLSTLDTVHWTGDFYGMEGLKGKGKDELSATMTLPGENFDYPLDYGLWIKGRITLAANDQDNLYSGFHGDYGPGAEGTEEEVAHRDKSSGRNKRPTVSKDYSRYGQLKRGNEFSEKMARDGIPYILDQSTWNPVQGSSNNEALVDNWRPVGIILTRGDEINAISGLDYIEGTKEDVEEFALGVIKKIMLTAIDLGVPVYDTEREMLWSPK